MIEIGGRRIRPVNAVEPDLLARILEDVRPGDPAGGSPGFRNWTLDDVQRATGRTFDLPLVVPGVSSILAFAAGIGVGALVGVVLR